MPSLAEKALQFSNHLPKFANMHGGSQSEQNKVPKGLSINIYRYIFAQQAQALFKQLFFC
jgi:hypothetical protein